ncbi:MAG: LysR substrate-binding domain-containing protein [Pseudorhodobacter sp.]
MHPGLKLRHIRSFLEIIASGSLSAAARNQGVTQPALSRSLAEMEAMLGTPLFLRQGRKLVLTEAGALFRRHAQEGLLALEEGARALSPGGHAGRLSVGVLPTVATRLFPRVALRFGQMRPDVTLSVESGSNTYLLRQLRDSRIDLMVGRLPGAEEMAGLNFQSLYEEDVILCARADHPMAGRSATEVLHACPVIMPHPGAIIRRPVEDYLTTQGLSAIRPAFETVSLAVGRALVAESDAVWFISRGVVLEELATRLLVSFETGAGFLSGAVGLTRRQGSGPGAPGLDTLITLLETAARDPDAAGHGPAPS